MAAGSRRRSRARSIPHLVIRTDGAARGNPGPGVARRRAVSTSRPDARDPTAPPGRLDLRVPGRPDEQRRRVHRRRAGARARQRLGAARSTCSSIPSSSWSSSTAAGGSRTRSCIRSGPRPKAMLARLRALVRDPRAARPELRRGRPRQRGDRPRRGGRPGAGRHGRAGSVRDSDGGGPRAHGRLLRRLEHAWLRPVDRRPLRARRALAGRARGGARGEPRRSSRRASTGGRRSGTTRSWTAATAGVPAAVPAVARAGRRARAHAGHERPQDDLRADCRRDRAQVPLRSWTPAQYPARAPVGGPPRVLLVAPPRLGRSDSASELWGFGEARAKSVQLARLLPRPSRPGAASRSSMPPPWPSSMPADGSPPRRAPGTRCLGHAIADGACRPPPVRWLGAPAPTLDSGGQRGGRMVARRPGDRPA